MYNILLDVECSPEMMEEMIVNPQADYRLVLVRADAVYLGDVNNMPEATYKFEVRNG